MERSGDRYLEELRELSLAFWAGSDVRIYLFGSRAKGGARKSSDADIAVEGGDALRVSLFREYIEESHIPYRCDVVDMNLAGEGLCEAVRREGIVWK